MAFQRVATLLLLFTGVAARPHLDAHRTRIDAHVPRATLRNGVTMPVVAAGTWQYPPEQAEQSVLAALSVGFDHIDTAFNYRNQVGVGKAISTVPRESLFVTTKIPGCGVAGQNVSREHCAEDSAKAVEADLAQLSTPYLDLLLLHFPPGHQIPSKDGCDKANCLLIQQQWAVLERFYQQGKLRAIGVSNYCVSCLQCLSQTMQVAPMVNQVQYHVGMGEDPGGLFSYARAHGVLMQSYSPLGNNASALLQSPVLQEVGQSHGKSTAQVALKWVLSQAAVVTKSLNPAHLAQDVALFDWALTPAEVRVLNAQATPAAQPSFMCDA